MPGGGCSGDIFSVWRARPACAMYSPLSDSPCCFIFVAASLSATESECIEFCGGIDHCTDMAVPEKQLLSSYGYCN